jgi:hypothetical protein
MVLKDQQTDQCSGRVSSFNACYFAKYEIRGADEGENVIYVYPEIQN